jgi:adenylate kinase
LDGYPRSIAQAKTLEEIVSATGCAVTQALYLAISDDEIVRRLSGRLTCRTCGKTCHEASNPPVRRGVCDRCGGELFRRTDDEPATIQRRITAFHEAIAPLLNYYRETGRLAEIAAEGPVHEVSARVIAKAKGARPGESP